MPYIHVRVGRSLNQDERDALGERIGRLSEEIPGKYFAKTMVDIEDGCLVYRGGMARECLFVETRLYKKHDQKVLSDYTEKLFAVFDEVLDIPDSEVYMNILELDHWASKGSLRS